ncbi:MAG: DNA-binding protein [Pseudonocardiales bacterium]|nr:MAG: DNA-binding protein [Pseudonocardiales bacterium]
MPAPTSVRDPLDVVLLYRPAEAARVLNLGRSVIFDLLRTGRLRSVKQGSVRLIPAAAIHEYIALLETEAAD